MTVKSLAGKRIASLMNIPAPTTVPSHNALHERCQEHGCELLVVYDEQSEPNRDWAFAAEDFKYQHRFATGFRIPIRYTRSDTKMEDVRYLQVRVDILPILFRYRPDLVISGQMGFRTVQAALYCKLLGKPLVIGWQGTPYTEAVASWRRKLLRKLLIRAATHIVARSEDAKRYLLSLGAPAEKISRGGAAVNTAQFVQRAEAARRDRDTIRTDMTLSGTVFLFLGQFIERKGLRQYLEALDRLYRERPDGWSLLFVGRGDLESEIVQWGEAHPGVPLIIHPPVQPAEVPRFYAAADVFVMPTLEDVWGNTCLEALLTGLPQLSSIYAGAVGDLLDDPHAGLTFDPYDLDSFGALLTAWVAEPPPRLAQTLIDQHQEYFGLNQRIERQWTTICKVLGVSADAVHQGGTQA